LGKILEILAPLRARGDLPVSALMAGHAQHIPRGSTVIVVTPSTEDDVALAVDLLSQRGLRPIVVLVDAASFGGAPGTGGLADAVTAVGAPVCQVGNGDDLSTALSLQVDVTSPSRLGFGRAQITRRMVRS
jgi:hypothetical protein